MIDDPLLPPVGVFPAPDGRSARWRVWAPSARAVTLVLDPEGAARRVAMCALDRGYHEAEAPLTGTPTRYGYSLDGGPVRPDPASRWQPDGIDRPSAVVDPARFAWDEGTWDGVADRRDLVFYELHVGTFTPEGTFDAVIPRLPALRELGITAIELMPVAQFGGTRGWGYDGVHPFAPQHSYGGPEGLQRLVAACHRAGLAVVLDVVYNHVGPEGNHLAEFGPYFNERYRTDWGPAVNYDGRSSDPVRAFVLQNARQWISDFRLDGLRLDAADQIFDQGPSHLLAEIAAVVHDAARSLGRPASVFAETDLNNAPRFLGDRDGGGFGHDGHWNDDFHHAVHVALGGEPIGYFRDFADGPRALASVYARHFVNDGGYSPFRDRRHGADATGFAGDRFVAFIQNHDQVANGAFGRRIADRHPAAVARLAAGLLLLAPRLPLLFQGEEYGETRPFPYFCDLSSPELSAAVRTGRAREFAAFGRTEEPPDPVTPATRDSAVLSWDWSDPDRSRLRGLYADLLRLRRTLPGLRDFGLPRVTRHDSGVLDVVRGSGPDAVRLLFNLTDRPVPAPASLAAAPLRSEAGPDSPDDQLRPHEFAVVAKP